MPCNDSERQAPDLDAAVEVFCERVVYEFARMPADDQDWYRREWRPTVEATIAAALPGTEPSA